MLRGAGAVLDQTAFPNAPAALASDEECLLPRQEFRKLQTFLFSPDELIHVDLVPETSGNFLARNQRDVDFVPKYLLLPPQVDDGAEDGIERGIQMFAKILGEKTQDMAAVFLK